MPDVSGATICPHCGEEVGMGHYVCWNCSRDIRLNQQTESEILSEYHMMVAREEIRLEERNRRFFVTLVALLLGTALLNLALRWHPGTSVLLVLIALFPVYWVVKASRRIGRIKRAQEGS
jgi:hypothetical protein